MAFTNGVYLTDGAVPIVVKVETDRFANTDFAWTAPTPGSIKTGYGSVKPRRVFGVCRADAVPANVGKARSEIVPDIGANVWTGMATSFTVEDPEGVEHTYTITSRRGELLHLA
jgi:hypothetical protein